MKLEHPKEWFERSAEIEGTSEVGAGCPAVASSRCGEAWTLEDLRTLRLLAGKIPAKEIARILNRSLQRTHLKAARNGISLAMAGEDHHAAKYPNAFVEVARRLSEDIPVLSCSQIGRILGVPPKRVADWCRFDRRTNDPVDLQ
jgi:hypothetical protein